MTKLKKLIDHLEEYILLPSLAFSVALIFFQVIMRYAFKNSLSWSEELARYIFVWQLWLGVSYATKNSTHIRIILLRNALKEKGRKVLETIALVIWFAFGCFIIVQGWKIAMQIGDFGQKSPALGLPMVYAYLSVPVGAFLMNLRLIQNFVKIYRPETACENGGTEVQAS
jgi:TRAP-type C4-dicarboxylate transport system permease small subunit